MLHYPIFQVLVLEAVPEVPNKILDPKNTWDDAEAYEQQAKELARRFKENFEQFTNARPEIISIFGIVIRNHIITKKNSAILLVLLKNPGNLLLIFLQ